jgi:hypothetical protein
MSGIAELTDAIEAMKLIYSKLGPNDVNNDLIRDLVTRTHRSLKTRMAAVSSNVAVAVANNNSLEDRASNVKLFNDNQPIYMSDYDCVVDVIVIDSDDMSFNALMSAHRMPGLDHRALDSAYAKWLNLMVQWDLS